MKKTPWPVVSAVVLCLALPALTWAGAPQATFHLGQKAGRPTTPASSPSRSARVGQPPQNQPMGIEYWCPGVPFQWSETFAGNDWGGIINVGDHVHGTFTVSSGFVFLSCTASTVNDPGATCSVSPDGLVISFDLPSVQGPSGGDIYGDAEVAPDAPWFGTGSVTVALTLPHTYLDTSSFDYECTIIPTLGTPGLAVLALLLAGLALVVLLRRSQA